MQSVAKFVTKAYPVSGCFDYLSEVCVCVWNGFVLQFLLLERLGALCVYRVTLELEQW